MRVARGATRLVILTQNYALKVPSIESWELFLCGLLSNMSEKIWSGFAPQLCPVLWSIPGGFLNVMPRVDTLSRCLKEDIYEEHFGNKEDYTLEFVENKPHHFGYYQGRLVAVDYGQPFVIHQIGNTN
jgi:hypothetical protein